MLKANLGSYPRSNQASIRGFKIQEVVKMYGRLLGCDNFRGFDLPNGTKLSAITKRISAAPPESFARNA